MLKLQSIKNCERCANPLKKQSGELFHLFQSQILIGVEKPVAKRIPSPADIHGFFIRLEKIGVRHQFGDLVGQFFNR
jgi:hypothetical protein